MKPERLDLRPERLALMPERLDLMPERPDLGPERPDLRPERMDLRPEWLEKLERRDVRTDGRMVERMDIWKFTPVSYRTSALWGRCPKSKHEINAAPVEILRSREMNVKKNGLDA